jgi:hypothetical protein
MHDWLALLDAERHGLALGNPASDAELADAEEQLSQPLPAELASLLRVANGFDDSSGQWQCSWDTRRIASENLQMWANDILPDSRLAFGDNGAGDPFCVILHGESEGEIEEWSPIEMEANRSWPDLATFWCDWLGPGRA